MAGGGRKIAKTESHGLKRVQAVDRALEILEALADMGPGSLSMVADRVKLSVSTTYRLMKTLEKKGFVAHDPERGEYRLGLKVLRIGAVAMRQFDIRNIARPYLKELVARCNETANLVVLDRGEVVYIEQVESSNMVRMLAELGSRLPATCTGGGKALLAYLEDQELTNLLAGETLVAYTPRTITSWERLKEELRQVRERGYAIDDEEREVGVRCVAAPIFGQDGKVVAALSVSGPSTRLTVEYIQQTLGPLVREYAGRITAQLSAVGRRKEEV